MEKEGSTAGFVLSLIGGIFSILGGIVIVFNFLLFVWASGFLGQKLNPVNYLIIVVALYFAVLGVWIIYAGNKMRKNVTLRKGAITSLVLGILSLNILVIIGGAIGLSKSKHVVSSNVSLSPKV